MYPYESFTYAHSFYDLFYCNSDGIGYLHRLIASKSESFESEGSDLEPEALLKARG